MALTPRLSGQVAARAHHSGAARLLKRAAPFFAIGEVSGGPLLIASLIALVLVNSPVGPAFERIWDTDLRLSYGGEAVSMPLSEWVNDGLFAPGLGRSKDPIIGDNSPADSEFKIARPKEDGGSITIRGFSRFVTTRGGAYCFFPSLPALRHIASL